MEKSDISSDKQDDDDVNAPDNKKILNDIEKRDEVTVKLNVPSVLRPTFLLTTPKCLSGSLRQAILGVSNLRVIVLSIAVTYLVSLKIECHSIKESKFQAFQSNRFRAKKRYSSSYYFVNSTDNIEHCVVYVEFSLDANLSCM